MFVVVIALAASIGLVKAAPNAPGDLDMTFAGFGTGGQVVTTGVGGGGRGMALQPDGKIVVVGDTGLGWYVMRYLPNGTLDSTFSGDGLATFLNQQFITRVRSVALQADGKIVVAGWAEMSPVTNFMLARVTAAGTLDASFGSGGFVTTRFDADSQAFAVLIQPDGKIVAAGRGRFSGFIGSDYDFAVARYNSNGSLDTTFDGDGKAHIDFGDIGPTENEECNDIALQADGKLVLVGGQTDVAADAEFKVARLSSDGTLDNTFNSTGKRFIDLGDLDPHAHAVAIQPDGKIVVAGNDKEAPEIGSHSSVLVVRILPNGFLDDSFDGDGQRVIGSLTGSINDVVLQPDGKIMLLGSHASPDNDAKFAFYRLNPDGALDTTFYGEGRAFVDVGGSDVGYALALQADGRIIAGGATGSNPALVRLWPDGTPDTGGRQTLGFADPNFGLGSDEVAYGMAIQPDGKIVLAGEVINPNDTESDVGLARFLPNGQLDTSFGDQGRVWFGFGQYNVARAVALQPDGKIVVAGFSKPFGSAASNFLVARFNPDGALDHTFALFGFNVVDFAGGDDYGTALALAPDGKTVVAGEVWNGSRNVFGVARLLDNGALDTSFDGDGRATFDWVPVNWASAVVVQPDRKIIVGGHVALDFALVRFNANGPVDATFGSLGATLTDMGGSDDLRALILAPDGWLYAAGLRDLGSGGDFALAQYTADGVPASCDALLCFHWSTGKAFVNWGGAEAALALDWRDDGQIVAAGCAGGQFAWAQLPTNPIAGFPIPIKFTTNFVGNDECALGVKFIGSNKLVLAGYQQFNGDRNMALARFETTVNPNAPVFNVWLPIVVK
jgi:uncharacterized delta-60 repeat protein